MSNFYYKSKDSKNLVMIDISNSVSDAYQAMNEVSNQCKWRKTPIELWHKGFDGETRKLTTICPEYKK